VGAARPATLTAIPVVLAVGTVILLPALSYLYVPFPRSVPAE